MTDRDKLLLYIDDNLSEDEKCEIEVQIQENEALREEYYLLRHTQKCMHQRPPEPSPKLWNGIQARMQEESLWNSLAWAGKRLIPLTAAAAVISMAYMSDTETEANTTTVADYFDDQTDLVLSEIVTDGLDIYPAEDVQ